MGVYLLRRLMQSVLILIGISFVTFFLLYVLPADPVRQIAGRAATAETVESIRKELGLDQPFSCNTGVIWRGWCRAIWGGVTCNGPRSLNSSPRGCRRRCC